MTPEYGAYGVTLAGFDTSLLVSAPPHWERWTVDWRVADEARPDQEMGGDRALVHVVPDGFAEFDRRTASSHLVLPAVPTADALIHPHLSSTAVIRARWRDLLSFHCGCFIQDGSVWALVGQREAGKSSMLAWLHTRGLPIFSDDILVTDGKIASAGPRCLDLRQGAHEHFGLGESLGRMGTRDRWRVRTGDVEAELPLAGWIDLAWNDECSVVPVGLEDRVRTLATHRGVLVGDEPTGPWLSVMSLPMFRFSRPRDWARLDESAESLLQALPAIGGDRAVV